MDTESDDPMASLIGHSVTLIQRFGRVLLECVSVSVCDIYLKPKVNI